MGTACSCDQLRSGAADADSTVGQSQSVRHSQQDLAAEDAAAARQAATLQEICRILEESENEPEETGSGPSIGQPAIPSELIQGSAVQPGQPSGQMGSAPSHESPPVTQVCDVQPEEIVSEPPAAQDQPAEQVMPNLSGVWKHTHDVTQL